MKALKLAMAAFLVLGAARASAADQTNLVQTLFIRLTGLQQGRTLESTRFVAETVDSVRVDTRRVIEALAVATANTFSSTSRLVVVTPVNGGVSQIQVRDGANKVDVSTFFSHDDWSDAVRSSLLNKATGRFSSASYSIQHFALRDSDRAINLHFEVSGFTEEDSNGGQSSLEADVAGAGDRNGKLLILRGFIGVFGDDIEVVPSNDDDGGIVS